MTIFLVMVGYLPGVLYTSTVGRWALIIAVGLPTALIVLVEDFDWSRPDVRWLTALSVWIALSFFWTSSPWDTAGFALNWVSLVGLGILAGRLENATGVALAIALGAALSAPIALLEATGHRLNWTLVGSIHTDVVGGLFLSSSALAEVSVVALILMLFQGRWTLAGLCGLTAALSARKEALVMLAVAGLVWLWLRSERVRLSARTWVLAGLTITALIIVNIYTATFHWTLSWEQIFGPPVIGRLEIWSNTIPMLSFLGGGAGTYAGTSETFAGYGAAHNEPLQLLFELGFGAGFVFALGGYVFGTTGNVAERVALSALAASSLVWAPLQDPAVAALVSVLAGYLCGQRARARRAALVHRPDDVSGADWAGFIPAPALRAAATGWEALAPRPEYPLGSRDVPAGLQRGR